MKPKQEGFTLIELMIVVAILGVLVGIVLVAINPVRMLGEARDGRTRSDLNQVKAALQLYHNENGDYPTAVEFTAVGGASPPNFTSTYMRQLPTGVTLHYAPDAANDDYDLGGHLAWPTTDDNNTATKCATIIGGAVAGDNYFVCPD